MVKKNRIFISFAAEDSNYRDLLVGQAKNALSPFSFVDMSVKQPWDSAWKTNCRTKIKGCDGMIAIITNRSINADGQRWEIKCANEEGIPVIGLHAQRQSHGQIPSELIGKKVIDWTWNEIKAFLDSL
jgi:nucleoside 2-deoxyribosyltransferase